jgi:hypothetical protein
MRYGFLSVFFIIFLGIFNSVQAGSTPPCTLAKVKVQDKNILLLAAGGTKQVYVIQNARTKGLWIDHPVARPSASAGWSSYVRAGNWSALVVDRKEFTISCAVIQPGKVEYQDCVHTISVCSPKEALFKSATKGTYWLAEDKPLDELVKAAAKRGVTIKMQ